LCQAESLAIVPGTIPIASIVADSTQTTGLKWAAPASGGGMTSIASGSLTGSTVSLTSISGSYKNLQLVLRDYYLNTNSNPNMFIKLNSITNYNWIYQYFTSGTAAAFSAKRADTRFIAAHDYIGYTDMNASSVFDIYDYTSSVDKIITGSSAYKNASSVEDYSFHTGNAVMSAAVTSIDITVTGATFDGGTYILYGVN
jgi:hypothetical protein